MFRFNNFMQHMKIILYIIRKSKLFTVTTLLMCSSYLSTSAQHKLSNNINLPKFEGTSMREVFDVLKQDQALLFSYNSKVLYLDRETNMDSYQGPLLPYLEKLLGEKYSFKETNSHIIITYAPQQMNVSAIDMDSTKHSRTRVSGYVKDVRTNAPVSFVTVYDKTTFQSSTLTNKRGYFELDLKHPEGTFTIALSKENYRDTMLVLLLPVQVSLTTKERRTGYYYTADSSKMFTNTAFGNFFTSSRQRLQNLNLGGFFIYSPFQISLIPRISTHGLLNSQVVNKFSVNIIGGYTAGVEGTELAGVFNVNQFQMYGAQFAGLLNVVGGDIKGLQAAGMSNIGLRKLSGVQLSGIWNRVDTITAGAQITGVINTTNNAPQALQLAGVVNIAKDEVGSQIAGVVNKAKKVNGLQLGLINLADSNDYPVGLFNWIRNGSRQLSLGFDESSFMNLNFKSGGRVLYSIVGLGISFNNNGLKYGAEFGIGGHLINNNRFTLSTELLHRIHFDKDLKFKDANRSSLRIIPAVNLNRYLQVYVAPALTYTDALEPGAKRVTWKFWGSNQKENTLHGSGTIGLTYVF